MYLESKSECKIFNKDGDQNVYLFHFFLSLPCWAIFFFFSQYISGLCTYNYFKRLLQKCCSTFVLIICTSMNTQVMDFGKYEVQILYIHTFFYFHMLSSFLGNAPLDYF